MKVIFYSFFAVFLFLSSCAFDNQDIKPPENLIPIEHMAVIIADIYIAEAIIDLDRREPDSVISQKSIDYYHFLFEKHNVNKDVFLRNFEFYLQRPKEIEAIFEIVNETINEQKAKY